MSEIDTFYWNYCFIKPRKITFFGSKLPTTITVSTDAKIGNGYERYCPSRISQKIPFLAQSKQYKWRHFYLKFYFIVAENGVWYITSFSPYLCDFFCFVWSDLGWFFVRLLFDQILGRSGLETGFLFMMSS